MYNRVQLILAVILLLAAGCQKNEIELIPDQKIKSPKDFYIGSDNHLKGASISMLTPARLDRINDILEAKGANYRVAWAEYMSVADKEEMGHIVVSKNVGNKQLSADFVPGDPRREWSGESGTKITYAIDQTEDATPSGELISPEKATEAIEKAINTWDAVKSTNLGLTKNEDGGADIGVNAFLLGKGGSPFVYADIQFCGWGDLDFNEGVLGVTYTFIWTANGNPTDINRDKKIDVAFREIYFDPSYLWDDGGNGIDVQSIALHELGHGLSQAHFGNGFLDKNREIRFSPRAVMNPYYFGTFRNLQKSDIGGHSSIWANWPKK